MLMDVVQWLRESGLQVKEHVPVDATGPDAVLEVAEGDHTARFAVQVKGRAPYPHEVERLRRPWQELAPAGHPLLAAPFVTEPLGRLLTQAGWSWADEQGNFDLRAPGFLLRQRRSADVPTRKGRSLPGGSGSLAIIRMLVRSGSADEARTVTTLANKAGVSQPRASQVLRQLRDLRLAERSASGHWRPDREALLDRFLAEYSGPGGAEQYCYSLDSLTDVVIRASQADVPDRLVAVSADVGPDLIVPWRRPSVVILYSARAIDPADFGLVSAQGPHDANVILRMPADQSVFPSPPLTAQFQGRDIPLADPLQQVWDLEHLGGADRIEAAGKLREWLLARH